MTDENKSELAPAHGADGRFLPGRSGNPNGRPPGIIDKRQRLQKIFSDEGEGLVNLAVNAAKDGNMQALAIALARVVPPIKATGERVEFDLDPDMPLSVQANQILVAVSEGKLDADTGRTLIACIHSVAGIKAAESLEQRVTLLEARVVS